MNSVVDWQDAQIVWGYDLGQLIVSGGLFRVDQQRNCIKKEIERAFQANQLDEEGCKDLKSPCNFTVVPPTKCVLCGNVRLHKSDNKNQTYKDLICNEVVEIQVRRQRYRCSSCGNKQWDTVIGASSADGKKETQSELTISEVRG